MAGKRRRRFLRAIATTSATSVAAVVLPSHAAQAFEAESNTTKGCPVADGWVESSPGDSRWGDPTPDDLTFDGALQVGTSWWNTIKQRNGNYIFSLGRGGSHPVKFLWQSSSFFKDQYGQPAPLTIAQGVCSGPPNVYYINLNQDYIQAFENDPELLLQVAAHEIGHDLKNGMTHSGAQNNIGGPTQGAMDTCDSDENFQGFQFTKDDAAQATFQDASNNSGGFIGISPNMGFEQDQGFQYWGSVDSWYTISNTGGYVGPHYLNWGPVSANDSQIYSNVRVSPDPYGTPGLQFKALGFFQKVNDSDSKGVRIHLKVAPVSWALSSAVNPNCGAGDFLAGTDGAYHDENFLGQTVGIPVDVKTQDLYPSSSTSWDSVATDPWTLPGHGSSWSGDAVQVQVEVQSAMVTSGGNMAWVKVDNLRVGMEP